MAIFLAFLTTNSKYYKIANENLNLIAYSNKPYSYYLYDANGASTGYYGDANTVSQQFKVRATPAQTIYQIKIPVSEVGYYSLGFIVDFVKPGAGQSSSDLILNSQMTKAVGCQVVHSAQAQKALTLMSTSSSVEFSTSKRHSAQALYSSDDRYQWKTLAPSLAEDVSLTFKATDSDVDTGFVLWSWEFTALAANTEYILNLTNINIEKIVELDSSNTDPYFNFAQTSYVNNVIYPNTSNTVSSGSSIAGHPTAGFTRHAAGKGTFVTNATANSLTMQVAPLYAAWDNDKDMPMVGTDGTNYQNYVGINIPLKNIEYDTNYKVAFDFSIARQGTVETDASATAEADVLYDSNYDNFFHDFVSTNTNRTLTFQSYIHSGKVSGRLMDDHTSTRGRSQITMANKSYPAHEVTRFDELRKYKATSTSYKDYQFNSKVAINNLGNEKGSNANMHNAVRHTEVNGQNTIYWYTFFNSSFTFNISSSKNSGLNLNDLYWVWAIDALYPSRYFRVKIENVRLEKVMQYGADIPMNGIKINGKQVTNFNKIGNETTPYGPENFLRGSSGTGQNYQALAYGTGISMAAINTFDPIYDAGSVAFTSDSANDYKIELDGYCVVDGGVEKYVWSPDLGKTWHDMVVQTPLTAVDKATMELAERKVDQSQIPFTVDGKSRGSQHDSTRITESVDANGYHTQTNDTTKIGNYTYDFDHIDFEVADTINSDFSGFKLYADISAYKNVWDMEIIFAAVPVDHADMKCEILRITNVNPKHKYRSKVNQIKSDIVVVKDYTNYAPTLTNEPDTTTETKQLNAVNDGSTYGNSYWPTASYVDPFTVFYGKNASGTTVGEAGYYYGSNPNSIDRTRTLFSGIPIKNKLTVDGWVISTGGTDSYWYSVDDGKNWKQVTEGTITDGSETNTTYINECSAWLNTTVTAAYLVNGRFNLVIDLSEHTGKLINVIVASKPKWKDSLCPIAKVDNVSVCGDHLYYSRYNSVSFDDLTIASDSTDHTLLKYNNLGLTSGTVSPYSYSYYEPYNIDLWAAKKITTAPVPITNGGKIAIDGFVVGTGGIKEYRYSLDKGETWVKIDIGENFANPNLAIFKASKLVDWEFNVTSGSNGNFSSKHGQTRKLEFNIPSTFTTGEKVEIMVVAVSNDTTEALYPVMNATMVIQ